MTPLEQSILSTNTRARNIRYGIRQVVNTTWVQTSAGLSPIYEFSIETYEQAIDKLTELLDEYLLLTGRPFNFKDYRGY